MLLPARMAGIFQMIPYQSLNGSMGKNRAAQGSCQIKSRNDLEAIYSWLEEYTTSPQTHRSYKKEAERLLLWSIIERHKALSDLNEEDFKDYIVFLSDPKPYERWCGPNIPNRFGNKVAWYPFTGPLKQTSINAAVSILRSLFEYLVTAEYLVSNPLSLIRAQRRQFNLSSNVKVVERILEPQEWQCMLDTFEILPEDNQYNATRKERLRWVVAVLYFLGLRVEELANHKMSAFYKREGGWWFKVIGKGNKEGRIPVNSSLLQAMMRYRLYFELSTFPSTDEMDTPIIGTNANFKESISSRRLHQMIKDLALRTANNFKDTYPEMAEKLKKFSPHWLRHLSPSQQDRMGLAFKHIRENHRHASDATTRQYVHAFDNDRHEDMEKLRWNT
jgi:site-specific recombinase XerD